MEKLILNRPLIVPVGYLSIVYGVLLILLSIIGTSVSAQTLFVKNGETCIELYTLDDELGEYRTYMVFDDWDNQLTDNDIKILKKWKELDEFGKSNCANRWRIDGKRIEIDRPPYSGYIYEKD